MARQFVVASTQKLIASSAAVSSVPLTIATWVLPADTTTNNTVAGVWDNGSDDADAFYLSFAGAVGGDPVQAVVASAGSFTAASTTAGFSSGVWAHGCAVFASSTDRRVYLNGGSKGTDAASLTPTGLSRTTIGFFQENTSALFYSNITVAEMAIWNVALTDAEVLVLAGGFCPLFVRPQSIVAYCPLLGRGGSASNEEDWVGTFAMTQTNSPAFASHPNRIIYPRRKSGLVIPNSVAAGIAQSRITPMTSGIIMGGFVG